MPEIINKIKNLPTKVKIIFLSLVVVSIVGMVMLFAWSKSPDYQVLYSNIPESDTGLIIQKLKEMKVPYKVEFGNVLVPLENIYDLRLQLATQGLPQGGGIGFELFDETSFGTTDFVHKINYRRALQGELARTINSLKEVEQTRVHLSIPEKSLFVREEDKPSASVFIKLKPGKRLTSSQVEGIVHLISSSIDGLVPKNVTIIDNNGQMLTRPDDETIALNNVQHEYKRNYEKDMESRIINILEPIVGKEKVRAKVNAEIDFTQTESTEEKFDPKGQVIRSEQNNHEKEITLGKGGVPGVASNLPDKETQTSSSSQIKSDKKTETINYEISKITKHVKNSYSDVKRLSCAVIVDGKYISQKDATKPQYTARIDKELQFYEDLVKKAIGYSVDRGDEVTVVNMPFETISQEEFPEITNSYQTSIMPVVKGIVPLLIAVLFFLFVARPLIKTLSNSQIKEKIPQQLALPQSVAELEMSMEKSSIDKDMASEEASTDGNKTDGNKTDGNKTDGNKTDGKSENKLVIEWAKNNPQQVASLIKGWISG
jgi:flagellar M-ring protein FliF